MPTSFTDKVYYYMGFECIRNGFTTEKDTKNDWVSYTLFISNTSHQLTFKLVIIKLRIPCLSWRAIWFCNCRGNRQSKGEICNHYSKAQFVKIGAKCIQRNDLENQFYHNMHCNITTGAWRRLNFSRQIGQENTSVGKKRCSNNCRLYTTKLIFSRLVNTDWKFKLCSQ